jgi:hypothetical protein
MIAISVSVFAFLFGVIVTYALQFAYTGRVMIIAFLFILYAGVSFALFEAVSRRIIDWHPQVEIETFAAQVRRRAGTGRGPIQDISR